MRHPLRHALSLIVVAIVVAGTASAAAVQPTGGTVPREIVVKMRANANANALSALEQQLDSENTKRLSKVKDGTLYRMRSRSKSTEALTAALQHNPNIEWAEPNFIIRLGGTPNDPSYASLWGLKNTGQSVSGATGIAGADIDAEAAWDVTTGSSSIVVGVVDTGVDYTHPDLATNMWSNPGGIGNAQCAAGTKGFNAVDGTCNPMDDHSHGTHVAGTIGAAGNNSSGVTGVSWNVSIMALKFIAANGYGTTADAIAAIDFAVQAKIEGVNVRVLSNSWGGGAFSKALLDVINKANENDILFVAAAGNDYSNNDIWSNYPSNYATANMIAVAATDNRDRLAPFSNYGQSKVHLGAPGVYVLSTIPGNAYSTFSGTSMATPHVAGVAALVLAKTPSLTTAQVKSAILDSVDPIPSLAGRTTTGGRLNAAKAVGGQATPDFMMTVGPASRTVTRGGSATYTVTLTPANGFNGSVTLSATNLPAGMTATFTPATTSSTSTLSVTTDDTTPLATHTLTITGTSGAMTREATAFLAVTTAPQLAVCPSFTSTSHSTGYGTALTIADFNRDGRMDVAIVETELNRVQIRLASISYTYSGSVLLPTGNSPMAVTSGDFNGDGRLDVATANYAGNNVSVILATGTGGYASPVHYPASLSPFALAPGDFDRDGDLDLVVANNGSSNVSVLLGQGDGTFAAPVQYAAGSGPYWITTGDVDGDGKLDVAVANFNANTVSLLRGNGDGTLQTAASFAAGQGPSSVALADVDGDGRLDLAVSNYKTHVVSLLNGNGDGTFDAPVAYGVGTSPTSVAAGDLNADGKADLVTTNSESGNLSFLLNTGTGTFGTAIPFVVGYYYYPGEPAHAAVGDLNNDGRLDIAVANPGYGGFIVVRNVGDCALNCGTFGSPVAYSAGTTPRAVAAGDFNADGRLDLASVNAGSNSISISIGGNNGTFSAGVTVAAGTNPHGIAAGDFNRDGKLDLAAGSADTAEVVVLSGNGDGTFQNAVAFATSSTPRSVAAGDFNRDGKLDLAVGARGSDAVSILLGNGDGTFASAVDYGTGDEPEALTVGDFNRDGKLDLATANAGSANISLLLGNGDGTFQTATHVAAGTTPQGIIAADLNADGRRDLAVANGGSDTVTVLRGNGDGTFQTGLHYDTGDGPAALAAADWNRDGLLDLAVANNGSNSVSILYAQDTTSFHNAVSTSAGSDPAGIAAGDWNGDGTIDLAITNSAASTTSVVLNRCPVPDLTVAKTHTGSFAQGQTGKTYTITVTNSGAGPSSGVVTVTDTLPPGLTATAISGTGWACTLGSLTCTRTDVLAGGASYPAITLTVNVLSHAPSSVTNNVTVSGGNELNAQNNSASDVTTITGTTDLNIRKTHTGNFAQGATGRVYTIVVRNLGLLATSGTVTVTDALPSGLTATAMSGTGWNCSLGSLTCTRSDSLAGATNYPPITLTVNVAANAPASVVNTASVSGGGDANSSNNTVSDPTMIWTFNPCNSFGRTVYGGTNYALGMAVADFNGDGNQDVATNGYYEDALHIRFGQANGTLAAAVTYATGDYPRKIAAGDFNRDGSVDLVVTSDSGMHVHLNTGSGAFAAAVPYVLSYANGIAIGDFNDDGNPDAAVTTSGSVSVLPGNGDGSFGAAVSYVALSGGNSVVAADVNGDQTLDLIVPGYSQVAILLGDGDGTFASPTGVAADETVSVATGDFNGDGHRDLVFGTSYSGARIFTGAGNGTFQSGAAVGGYSSSWRYVTAADLNADGKLDVAGAGSYSVGTALGNGDGTFQTPLYHAGDGSVVGIEVSDFNRDGKADLAVVSQYYGVAIMLAGCADLEITKTHTGNFRAGQTDAAYTLTVRNVGLAYSAGKITVTDHLPEGLTLMNMYASGYYYWWDCTAATATCTSEEAIAPDTTRTLTVWVKVAYTAPSSVVNTATVSGGSDVNASNNTATDPTTISHTADLTINKSHAGLFAAGQNGVYTIAVGNVGTGATSGTVTVFDNLPSGMTAVSMSGTGWACTVANRTCTRSDVLGATASYPPITLTVSVAEGISASVTNVATVSGGGDSVASNNSAADVTSILVAPGSVQATPVSAAQVQVTWSTVSGGTQYEVLRSSANGPYTVIATTVSGLYFDSGRSPNTTYLYKVRALNGATVGPLSVADLATTVTFTNDPMKPGGTLRASDIEELRGAVNMVRAAAGITPIGPDGTASTGSTPRTNHLTQLLTALNQARAALGISGVYGGDVGTTLPIRASHINLLRAGVK